ncbi:hypothetical protein AMTR_s00020p00248820 [Amborella trichopoda]|uniref:Uncharacterized protein n=1 Tax=Amborella trichopoda TaxID=13333 RepID=W1PX12_AMBTC|nr:hypothetical protein AMTR_s00020p00248820 [Amborella trichopoda]
MAEGLNRLVAARGREAACYGVGYTRTAVGGKNICAGVQAREENMRMMASVRKCEENACGD